MSFRDVDYRNMTNDELVHYTTLDDKATARELELAERLDNAMAYIAEVTVFLSKNDLLEAETFVLQ